MITLPKPLGSGRGRSLAALVWLTLLQGAAAGAAAFATRALFEAMHRDAPLSLAPLSILVASGGVLASTRIAARYLGEKIGQNYAADIRVALFEHAARMPASAVAVRRPGYMSLRFVGDMTAFRNWLAMGLPRLIAACVLVPTMMVVLWLLDPVFAAVTFPVVMAALGLSVWGGRRLLPLQRRLRMRRARIAAEMAERMPLAPFLDRLGRRGKERRQLEKRTASMISVALRHRRAVEALRALPDLTAGIAASLVFVAGHRAGLGTGDIAAALAALGLLLAPLRDLGSVWNHRAAHAAAAQKAQAALSRGTRRAYGTEKSLPPGPVDVVFEDVALPSGQLLSIVAEGGGVTMLDLDERDAAWLGDVLLGLDDLRSGRICLSGIDLRALSRGGLRRHVLTLDAQPTILQGSLRRALTMGCNRRPEDPVLDSMAREAGLGGVLDRLGGLEGTVLEGGKHMTRSERLALSRVRILLARPRVVLVAHGERHEPANWLGLFGPSMTVLCLTHA